MLFKIDKHLSSILIAKGDKPAQNISYDELSTMENSGLTAVGLRVSDVFSIRDPLSLPSCDWYRIYLAMWWNSSVGRATDLIYTSVLNHSTLDIRCIPLIGGRALRARLVVYNVYQLYTRISRFFKKGTRHSAVEVMLHRRIFER